MGWTQKSGGRDGSLHGAPGVGVLVADSGQDRKIGGIMDDASLCRVSDPVWWSRGREAVEGGGGFVLMKGSSARELLFRLSGVGAAWTAAQAVVLAFRYEEMPRLQLNTSWSLASSRGSGWRFLQPVPGLLRAARALGG